MSFSSFFLQLEFMRTLNEEARKSNNKCFPLFCSNISLNIVSDRIPQSSKEYKRRNAAERKGSCFALRKK